MDYKRYRSKNYKQNIARRVEKLKAAGLCRSCGKRYPTVGRSRFECDICLDKKKAQRNKPESKAKNREWQRNHAKKKRLETLNKYGGKCACCGEPEVLFLDFDHVNNDGYIHRKTMNKSGNSIVKWVIKNNYPDTIQVLCSNCNQGKRRNGGICPHESSIL